MAELPEKGRAAAASCAAKFEAEVRSEICIHGTPTAWRLAEDQNMTVAAMLPLRPDWMASRIELLVMTSPKAFMMELNWLLFTPFETFTRRTSSVSTSVCANS